MKSLTRNVVSSFYGLSFTRIDRVCAPTPCPSRRPLSFVSRSEAHLWNNGDGLAKVSQAHAEGVDTVYRHAPPGRLDYAEEGHHERRFAGPRPARDADALAPLPDRLSTQKERGGVEGSLFCTGMFERGDTY